MERSNQFSVTNCICKGEGEPCDWIGFRDIPSVHVGCQQILFSSFEFGHFISTNAYSFLKRSLYSTSMQIFLFFPFIILSLTEKKKWQEKKTISSLRWKGFMRLHATLLNCPLQRCSLLLFTFLLGIESLRLSIKSLNEVILFYSTHSVSFVSSTKNPQRFHGVREQQNVQPMI